MEYKNGIKPLEDDQLESVAGGVSADDLLLKQAEMMARADGRKIGLADDHLASSFCSCRHLYKWARSDRAIDNELRPTRGYTDIKCYKCGRTYKGSIY